MYATNNNGIAPALKLNNNGGHHSHHRVGAVHRHPLVQHQPMAAGTSGGQPTTAAAATAQIWQMSNNNSYNNGNNNGTLQTTLSKKSPYNGNSSNKLHQQPQTPLKLVMVGLGGVGKSALTIQFVQQYFMPNYDPTISDSYTKSVFVDDALYKVEVLDTAGQEEYAALREVHLRAGDGFLLVFSVTSAESLDYVLGLRRIIERLKDRDHFPMILVGNKTDLHSQRQISTLEADELAARLQLAYVECSAKYRHNVDHVFHALIRQIRQFRYLERRCCNGGGHAEAIDETDQQRQKRQKRAKKMEKKKDKICRIQ